MASIDSPLEQKYRWVGLLVLVLPVVLAYGNSLGNPFHYDDGHSIVENPHIRQLANIPAFFFDATMFSKDPENAMYRPLLLTTYALNHAVSGYAVWSYHALGLVLHLICVWLVYGIGEFLLRNRLAAAFAALAFALHPVNTEALNYISSRSEVLAGLWVLLGLWTFMRYRSAKGCAIWPLLALSIGLLSKSIAIMLPLICLCYDLLFSPPQGERKFRIYIGMGGIALFYLVGVRQFLARAALTAPVRSYSEQLWTQTKAVVFYIKLLLWPQGLNVDHQFQLSDTLIDPFAASAFAFLCTVGFLALYHRKRHPLLLFSLGAILLSLAPSSLIPLNVLVNEHRLYLPSAFFVLALAYGANQLAQRGGNWTQCARGGAMVLLVFYGATTKERNRDWQSDFSLWSAAVDQAPLMARPHFYLAEAYYTEKGDPRAAIRTYEKGLVRDPHFIAGWARIGELYEALGELPAAQKAYNTGIEQVSDSAALWSGLAHVQRLMGRWAESAVSYRRALELESEDAALHNNLGLVYQALNKPAEALHHHRRALQIDDADVRTYVNLGTAHLMIQEFGLAQKAFIDALERDPLYAGAWNNLGYTNQILGDRTGAIRAYIRASELDADLRVSLAQRLQALQEADRE